MGRKAIGPVCCVMHVKEPRKLIVKERGLPRCSHTSTQQGEYVRATNLIIIIIIIILNLRLFLPIITGKHYHLPGDYTTTSNFGTLEVYNPIYLYSHRYPLYYWLEENNFSIGHKPCGLRQNSNPNSNGSGIRTQVDTTGP